MIHIIDTVGVGGKNHTLDVLRIQTLLRSKGYRIPQGSGICGTETVNAIITFQSSFLPRPTGLIEPYCLTLQKLSDDSHAQYERSGDSCKWSQDKKLCSLNPQFKGKVVTVLRNLQDNDFLPLIFYGWRSVSTQLTLFSSGRSKVKFSFHNAQLTDGTPNSYAADIIDSRYGWTQQAESSGFWMALGTQAKAQGLFWGGDWSTFRDVAHIQLLPNSKLHHIKQECGL
ncbi:MAG: peptidoglycan-binding protein [Geobacter sp.]|nr:MAG: peptidoglycan-binding protein [Geobacter sp.]